ncbi:MAG: sigma 54-interacting transcriptional regulator [Terriglobales bacterium]|jgi:formate hydrogenlyase transcriptional activator
MEEHAPGADARSQTSEVPNQTKPEAGAQRADSEILQAITDVIVGDAASPELFKKLVPTLQELANCNVVSFALYDAKRDGLVTEIWKGGWDTGVGKFFSVDQTPCGWAWRNQEPIAIPDLERETRFTEIAGELRNLGVRSYTALPMSTPTHHYGSIGVGGMEAGAQSAVKLSSLQRAAAWLGLAVENREVHLQWQTLQDRHRSLAAITSEVSALDLEQLIPRIFASVQQITTYDYARLGVLDADSGWLRVRGVDGGPQTGVQLREGQSIRAANAISARAIELRRATFHGADELALFSDAVAGEIRSNGVKSLCSVPLILGNQVLGTMLLGTVRENGFSREDGDYLLQAGTQIAIAIHNATPHPTVAETKDSSTREMRPVESEIRGEDGSEEIIGKSPALKRVLDNAAMVAKTDATVLLTGETGTGKERVARAIHLMSSRKGKPFIKLNCAAIPTGLLESELFGNEKGAFTGAVSQKVGRLELADQGTLLLDEVGEISLELQPKLLRVLQDHEFERLGGTKTIHVDVRLIAATNRDLEQAVAEKVFRADLFYRLHVFPLHLPPLRERREDIPLLIRKFVEECAARLKKRIDIIPDEAVEAMMNWEWPGNIRELENFIERSVILSDDNRLCPPVSELRESTRRSSGEEGTLHDRERDQIVETLRQTRGVLSGPGGAAARLGLKRTTLQYKMQKLGISRREYLN